MSQSTFFNVELMSRTWKKVTVHTGGPIWRENTVEEFFWEDLRIDRNWLKNGAKIQNLVKF